MNNNKRLAFYMNNSKCLAFFKLSINVAKQVCNIHRTRNIIENLNESTLKHYKMLTKGSFFSFCEYFVSVHLFKKT